jgi:hypothetical protein
MQEEPNVLRKGIDEYIDVISEKHRMHRKIQFLLDVRGLLIINKIEGNYAEFGLYRGEMMYAAGRVLGKYIKNFIGFDTFEGLPEPTGKDADIFVFEKPGFMACTETFVKEMMSGHPNTLIKGDFRTQEVRKKAADSLGKVSVASIDCNWPSSVEASLDIVGPTLMPGSIIFFDDYFVGTRSGDYMEPILENFKKKFDLDLIYFRTYPPCARAFVVTRK